jgi:hypothetical protein
MDSAPPFTKPQEQQQADSACKNLSGLLIFTKPQEQQQADSASKNLSGLLILQGTTCL